MFVAVFMVLLSFIGKCFSEENIYLNENEIETAIQACKHDNVQDYEDFNQRFSRNTFKQDSQYSSERRNISEMMNHSNISATAKRDFLRHNNPHEQTRNQSPSNYLEYFVRNTSKRIKRSKQMNRKTIESNQCLSQCVFANLHMVDKRGVPLEDEFWNKIRTNIKSHKSRASLEDQIRTCFHNIQSETENACSYSNKLERCLNLRFADRVNGKRQNHTEKKSCFY